MSGDIWPVSAIVLAAGASTRMGENKLLLDFNGKSMLCHTLDLIENLPFAQKILITTAKNIHDVKIPEGFKAVINQSPELGQSESVRLGVSASTCDYYMFFTGDMPFLDAETVRLLISQIEDGRIIVPTVEDVPKNPVIFSKCLRDELLSLSGDMGGRKLFSSYPERLKTIPIQNKTALLDIDTREDYEINR